MIRGSYTFDRVFQPVATQQEVYEFVAKPLVEDALSGFNWCASLGGWARGWMGAGRHRNGLCRCVWFVWLCAAAPCLPTVKLDPAKRTR